MRSFFLYLIVLSALFCFMLVPTRARRTPTAEMKQLTLADVNQATDHQEVPAVRLVRQLGGGRRFGGGRFGGGGFGGGGGPFGGGRQRFGGGRRRLNGPGFFRQPFGFFG